MSLIQQPLRGIIPPLVTPLRGPDELDRAGLERLIENQIQAGVAGIFLLGTTGEGPCLSYRLRYELVERSCEISAGRIPVLVGVTDTSLVESIELTRFSGGVGASAVVAAPPYYFPFDQGPVVDFLLNLADESALPLFAYNMPACVGINLTFESVARLATHENICGLKDSAGDMTAFKEFMSLRQQRPDWTFLMGPEQLTAESVLAGGDGGVAGGANLNPRLFVSVFEAAVNRDQAQIDRLRPQIVQLSEIYRVAGDGIPAYLRGLKAALEVAGFCSGHLTAPLQRVNETERLRIQAIVKTLDLGAVQVGY